MPTRPLIPYYDHLKQLEWMIGTWVDHEGGEVVKTECQWSRNKNFSGPRVFGFCQRGA